MDKQILRDEITDLQLLVLEKGKITCDDVIEVMGDYVDGELIPTVKARVDEHIASCEVCQEFLNSYTFTVRLAQSLRNIPPAPQGVQNRLRAALNRKLGLSLSLNAD